jgi:hypothetical protein
VIEEFSDVFGLAQIEEALEAADADVGVAEPHQHGGACRRGFVVAREAFARLDQAERFRGLDPERLQHLGRQHLAHAALERQPPISAARPGRLAAPLGGEVEKPSVLEIVRLREQKAAPVAELGVVGAELMAVVAQRQRLPEAAGQRLEPPEVRDPFLIRQPVEPEAGRPALVADAQGVLREVRRIDDVVEIRAEAGVLGRGFIGRSGRHSGLIATPRDSSAPIKVSEPPEFGDLNFHPGTLLENPVVVFERAAIPECEVGPT